MTTRERPPRFNLTDVIEDVSPLVIRNFPGTSERYASSARNFAATVSEEMPAPIIYLQPASVTLESDGNIFGIGNTEEECIADAISSAFYYDDKDRQRYPCTREWIERKLPSGELYFLHAENLSRGGDLNKRRIFR